MEVKGNLPDQGRFPYFYAQKRRRKGKENRQQFHTKRFLTDSYESKEQTAEAEGWRGSALCPAEITAMGSRVPAREEASKLRPIFSEITKGVVCGFENNAVILLFSIGFLKGIFFCGKNEANR